MKRRTLLTNVAGIAAAGAAGCLGGGTTGGNGTTPGDDPTTTPDDPTTTPDDPTPTPRESPNAADWNPSSASPHETATLGSREGVPFPDNNKPHTVRVWNAATVDREIALVFLAGDEVAYERGFSVPADGWVSVTINEPGPYEVAVEVDGERGDTLELGGSTFDCNDSVTSVAVGPEGSVDSITESTTMACGGPAQNGQSFARGQSDCGSRDDAAVEFREEAVHVTGAVRTPNPCSDLTLASVTLDGGEYADDESTLALTVATDGKRKDVCVDCVGTVEYEASVEFRNDYPQRVRVVHESMDDSRTVAEVERGPGTSP
ncbi:hypothetical protein BRD00_06295 [Halobacteriales archaeon QS_8_69_26]|nr:MAG: hypothetical protein BRD00_06295 [Halobacteriales archaeon QS_8_69_26]